LWNILRSLGCDDAQGYFMSKPLAPDLLAAWIRANDGMFLSGAGATLDAGDPLASIKLGSR
jgi:hypothetical protein